MTKRSEVGSNDGFDADAALDAVAQALVLADPQDPETLRAIAEAAENLAEGEERNGTSREALLEFLGEVRRIATGEVSDIESALERLGVLYGRLAATVSSPKPAGGRPTAQATAAVAEQPAREDRVDSSMPLAADSELVADFVARCGEHLDTAEENLLLLERDPSAAEPLNAVFRVFHTVKGMAGFLGMNEIEELAHRTESVLDEPRSGTAPLDHDGFEEAFAAVDSMRGLVAKLCEPSAIATPETSAAEPEASPQGPPRPVSNSVRVDEQRLDRLLETIGELVIAEAIVSGTARSLGESANSLTMQFSRLDKITRELQELATSLRMVPLKSTFVRLRRLVRDLEAKSGKRVELVTSGDETELDKLVVDRIYDPLVHIIRNAVDHGIETPAERVAAGKPTAGRIELVAQHRGGIRIEVRDDGGGLDLGRIRAKAVERGLLGADDEPDAHALADLLFEPGFSTASAVTDVSGRGVGMDVVRRSVEALRGSVEIEHEAGSGTAIVISLPLTLAIIDGMALRVGAERYILPMLAIERCVRPRPDQLSRVAGRGIMLATDEGLIPVLPLHRHLEVAGAVADPAEGVVVIVNENGLRAGLLACEILGQQQTVIKPLGDELSDRRGITGAAIMSDGCVGLILDGAGLVRLVTRRGE